MQSKAIICKFHSSPMKNLAFYALLSLFFHELITLQKQVQTIFYLIFLVIYFLLGHLRSLFSFFLSRNLSSWISMSVYLRVCHNLIRIWDEEKIILFQSGVLILPLFGTQEIKPLIIKTWQPFELQLLHSFVYDRTSWEFLFVISTCRLGILILQKQRKILATTLVMWVRIVSLLNLHL